MANVNRNINYLNRDFTSFRNALIEYSKTYFPQTYNDFTPASPGMMFMEMAAYVGDVMSFYLDNQVQETFLQYSRQVTNIFDLAYMLGYKPKATNVAVVDVDFYQQVPAIGSGASNVPDYTYALTLPSNTQVNNGSVNFICEDPINFAESSSLDPTEVSVYEIAAGEPLFYLLKKTRQAYSATIKETTFTFGSYEAFPTVLIDDSNIVGILDITDTEGNVWYEVDYIGQEMIMDSVKNTNQNNPNFSSGENAPYLLQLKKVQRRFATRLLDATTLQIQFGAGNPSDSDEVIIPNPNNVGLGLPFGKDSLTVAYSPTNFLYTDTYGIAPVNTTLTVRYLTGGGINSNVASNSITTIVTNPTFLNNGLNTTVANNILTSLISTNPQAASGGRSGDSANEVRQNTLANYQAQLRNITQDDYLVRALSMPAKYGGVAKAYIEPTKASNITLGETVSTLDLYVLGYNNQGQLVNTSNTVKQNLINYLSQYRAVNDSVRVKDAFIVNIGVNFQIITLPNYNNNDVLLKCITALQNFFNIDNTQINQTIPLSTLYIILDRIQGVQTVKNITITNKVGASLGYSNYAYDIEGATSNNTIYPSIDPMIFEVKYPNTDIQGKVVPL
jgi:hypothetical protein